MKEASEELNITVIVVIAIGVLMAFFYYTLWPLIKGGFESENNCSKAICENTDSNDDGYVECHSKKDESIKFKCVFKG